MALLVMFMVIKAMFIVKAYYVTLLKIIMNHDNIHKQKEKLKQKQKEYTNKDE